MLLFDVLKAFVAVHLCSWLFPELILAGGVSGCLTVIGHIFPFYTGFHGG